MIENVQCLIDQSNKLTKSTHPKTTPRKISFDHYSTLDEIYAFWDELEGRLFEIILK